MWGDDGASLGVAGVGIAVRYLIGELLGIAYDPAVTATFRLGMHFVIRTGRVGDLLPRPPAARAPLPS